MINNMKRDANKKETENDRNINTTKEEHTEDKANTIQRKTSKERKE